MPDSPPVDLPAEAPDAHAPDADAPPEPGVDGAALRRAMRRVASPVVVVTAEPPGGEPRGATIGSFTSLSLDPPLVSFNATRGTRLHAALRAARRFAVHLLAADQSALAEHFAEPDVPGEAQLAPYPHTRDGGGMPPVLAGTLGVLICRREKCLEAGDHTVFVGRVLSVTPGREGAPLVYHARRYRTVGEAV